MPRTRRRAPASSGRCSTPRRSSATSRSTTRTSPSRKLRVLERARRRHRHHVLEALRLPVVPEIFGFDPRLQFTHEDDVTGALAARDAERRARRSTTSPATARCRGARCARSSGSAASRSRRCSPSGRPSRCAFAASWRPPARGAEPAALRARRRQQPVQAHRLPLPVQHARAPSSAFARSLRLERTWATAAPYTFERDVETFFRHSPAVMRATRPADRSRTEGSG